MLADGLINVWQAELQAFMAVSQPTAADTEAYKAALAQFRDVQLSIGAVASGGALPLPAPQEHRMPAPAAPSGSPAVQGAASGTASSVLPAPGE